MPSSVWAGGRSRVTVAISDGCWGGTTPKDVRGSGCGLAEPRGGWLVGEDDGAAASGPARAAAPARERFADRLAPRSPSCPEWLSPVLQTLDWRGDVSLLPTTSSSTGAYCPPVASAAGGCRCVLSRASACLGGGPASSGANVAPSARTGSAPSPTGRINATHRVESTTGAVAVGGRG